MERDFRTVAPIVERTRAYILENFLYARSDVALGDTEPLFERGVIDSMGVAELITFIEEEFAIKVGDDEITEQNFGTLERIALYVAGKKAAAQAA